MGDRAQAVPIPVAHIGHFLWILYLLPILIVVFSILKTTISEKRAARAEDHSLDSDRAAGAEQISEE